MRVLGDLNHEPVPLMSRSDTFFIQVRKTRSATLEGAQAIGKLHDSGAYTFSAFRLGVNAITPR